MRVVNSTHLHCVSDFP